jgi:SAM-dependent methyltransferase
MTVEQRFAPVAHELRDGIIEHYRDRGQRLDTEAGLRTLDTNSTLAPRRAGVLLEVLAAGGGPADVAGLRIADLGCGFGALSLYFAAAGAEVVGIDPHRARSAVSADIARRLSLAATFQLGWIDDLVLPSESFDLAVLNNSLCYIVPRAQRRRAMHHMLRILAPGGWVVMTNPSRAAPTDPFTGMPLIHQLPPGLARRLTRGRTPPRSHVRLLTAAGASRELRRAGFTSVRSHRVGGRSWIPSRYVHHAARRPPES